MPEDLNLGQTACFISTGYGAIRRDVKPTMIYPMPRSPDLVHWKTIDGQKIELPITPKLDQFTVDPVPPMGGAINGGTTFFFDADKRPLIAYMKYGPLGNSQIFLARVRDRQWVTRQISNWDYRWDFSGPGSITFEIRLYGGKPHA